MVNERQFREIHNRSLKGDSEALTEMISMFSRQLSKNSYINGKFDEDCFQELNIKLLESIKKFKFDKDYDVFDIA